MLMNTHDQYGLIHRLLHWTVAALVVGMLLGGLLLWVLPSGGFKNLVGFLHKSTGVLILLLMLLRLAWRMANPRPRDLNPATPGLNVVAHLLHVCLYVLLLLQPLAGILMSQAYGYPVVFFGLFELPPMIWHSPTLGSFFLEVHRATAIWITIAVVVHVAAALKHHFVDRDRTLMRMIKGQ